MPPTWSPLGPQGALLGLKLEPSWRFKTPKSRPQRFPRRIWGPEPAQTFNKAPKWNPRRSKRMPQTLHFGSILVLILLIKKNLSTAIFLQFGVILMSISSQARWRVRSSAARWIRRARPCACAWRTESDTLTSCSSSFPSLILPNLPFLRIY